jgi:hypothetical protein
VQAGKRNTQLPGREKSILWKKNQNYINKKWGYPINFVTANTFTESASTDLKFVVCDP